MVEKRRHDGGGGGALKLSFERSMGEGTTKIEEVQTRGEGRRVQILGI